MGLFKFNPQSEFAALNEFLAVNSLAHVGFVHGIHLTTLTLNPKLFSDYVRGEEDGRPNFVFKLVMPMPLDESKFQMKKTRRRFARLEH